jgi:polyferredoxin
MPVLPPGPPRFHPSHRGQECPFCLAIIPQRAVRCAYCGSDVGFLSGTRVSIVIKQLATIRRQLRRLRWGTAFFFGAVAALLGHAFASHIADAAGSGKINLPFAISTGSGFIVSVLLVILTSPGSEDPRP